MFVTKATLLLLVSLIAQAGGPQARGPQVGGQQVGGSQVGSYRILAGDKPSGSERFEEVAADGKLIVKSFTDGDQGQRVTTMLELDGAKPVRYEVETSAGGRSQKYSLRFEAGIASVVIEAYGRRSERTLSVSEEVAVLDKNVWHHYALLIKKYDLKRRGAQRFPVITPLAGLRQYTAEVEHKGKTTFNAAGQKLKANVFIVTLAEGYDVEVTVDESNRVLSIDVPALEARALLQL